MYSIIEKMDGYPEIDYRFTTMQDYIDEISEFLEFIYGQKTQRLKARIKAESNEEKKWDLIGELNQLEEHGLAYLSHTIWGGVLVSIFATYESSVQDLFTFFEVSHGQPKFKKEKGKSFLESAQKYSITHLNKNLYINRDDWALLKDLSQLRNSYVHNSCRINMLPKGLRSTIIDRKYKSFSLELKDGRWIANSMNTKLYFKYVYQSFNNYHRTLTDLLFDGSTTLTKA